MKDLWIEAREKFIEDNNREPSEVEMEEYYTDYYSELIDSIDQYMDIEESKNTTEKS